MWRFGMLLTVIAILAAACTSASPAATGDPPGSTSSAPTASASASAEASADPAQPTAFELDVNGLAITGHCAGVREAGEPAILLLHGLGSNQRYFGSLFEARLAERTQVCTYDRPGASGDSDEPVERPRTVAHVADEARDVLDALGVEPPFFLIGHSAGGGIAQVLAHRHTDEIAGLVALNPLLPYSAWQEADAAVPPPPGAPAIPTSLYEGVNDEGIDFRGTDVILEPLPDDLPFAVVFGEDRTCGGFVEWCDEAYPLWMGINERVAATGAGGRFVHAEGSGHDVLIDATDLVNAVVDEVWAEVANQ